MGALSISLILSANVSCEATLDEASVLPTVDSDIVVNDEDAGNAREGDNLESRNDQLGRDSNNFLRPNRSDS